jgi:hypothetical protein
MTADAQNRWPDELAAGPFHCHADFSLEPHLNLLEEMSRLQRDVAKTLEVQPPRESIHLFLFQRKATYQRYIQQYFPAVPYRRALFIKERGPGMVFAHQNSEFDVDVRHESTHALLHAILPMVPLWLDEGLAEYFEVSPEERTYSHPHMTKLRWHARFGQVPSIEELERIRSLEEMGQNEYRDSWAWVHFMVHGSPDAHRELVAFLADIHAHTPPGKLSERLRRRVPGLERRFAEHFRSWKK